jgi:polygalacturonase
MQADTEKGLVFSMRDFGAVGDGIANDSAAIQRAIDACAASGGGRVVLHHGTFLSGTLHLRSHVELHLTSTAVLLGSRHLADYYLDPYAPYRIIGRSLIYAEGCEQIAITGQGTIDGQGLAFGRTENSERPTLIRWRDCTDARIESVLLKDGAAFTVHPIHCRQLRFEGLRIDSVVMPNSDGLDIDGCQDVFVSNCNIHSGDDSIALKAIEPGAPCRDVVITNCILSSLCAAIRIGPDALENIERVTVSNCVIRDTRLNGIKIQESFGAQMRDLAFSNIVMDNVVGPISLRLAGWAMGAGNVWAVFDDSHWEQGSMRNILFDNIRGRAAQSEQKLGISITGAGRAKPQQITFSNIDLSFPGGGTVEDGARRDVPDLARDYPECYIFGVLPAYGLYVHHAEGLTLHNVRFQLEGEDLRPAIVCDDVQELELVGFKAEGHARAEALLRLQNTRQAFITACRPLGAVDTFLRVEGEDSGEIRLRGNFLAGAGTAVQIAGAPAAAVIDSDQ